MTAMTPQLLSCNRFLCGIGPSGPQVVEGWHGVPYGKPLARTREYVAILRRILERRGPLEFKGERYRIPYDGPGASGLGKPLQSIVHGDPNLARARDQGFNVTLERDLDPALAPIEIVPQEMTRVLLNLFGNGFYAPTGAGARGRTRRFGRRSWSRPATAAPRSRSGCVTTAPASRPNTARNCSSRSSPPSPPAKAPASGCRSAGTS
jgi:hypothetical protein